MTGVGPESGRVKPSRRRTSLSSASPYRHASFRPMTERKIIGSVEKLWRYPVKSMKGESLTEVYVTYTGVVGDRIFALVNPDKRDNFPWHTAREQADMLLYKPTFVLAPPIDRHYPDAQEFAVSVQDPSGKTWRIDDPTFVAHLEQKVGRRLKLRFSEKGMHDARPLSIFGASTLDALTAESGVALDHRRFRPNLFVRWHDATPFYEDQLVGKTLSIGDKLLINIVKKDPRCIIINLDPETATAQKQVLLTVAKGHRGCAGVYAAVLREGEIKAGDHIALVDDLKIK